MKLAIFDIDGTLMRTRGLAHGIFVRVYEELFGIRDLSTDWRSYRHATDSGMAHEILERHFGRAPASDELGRVRSHFISRLRQEWERDDIRPAEVAGAAVMLRELHRHGWHAALATGNWRTSGLYKLTRAGITAEHLPGGFADDGYARSDIIGTAWTRARLHHRREEFDKVVYVGDAAWDVEAAARTGTNFLGVGGNGRDERLTGAGAGHIVGDFRDLPAVIQALDSCERPVYTACA